MSLPYERLPTEETSHDGKSSADTAVEFVLKLEPAWSMEEDSPNHPSAVYDTAQPICDNTPLLLLDLKHPCYLCPATFVLLSSLELHVASVHGEYMFTVFPGPSTLDRCDAGHCSNIDKGVKKRKKRTMLAKKVDGDAIDKKNEKKDRIQPVCEVCNKSFSIPSQLKRHMLIHNGVKPFVCDECGKGFTLAGDLTKHKRVHTGERPFKCPDCNSNFKLSGDLQVHIKCVHRGDKRHVCDVCGAAFSTAGNLKVHIRTHTGEKPHVCSDCGKGFVNSSALKTHLLKHTGQKPHKCSHCSTVFSLPCNLKRHMQSKHQ